MNRSRRFCGAKISFSRISRGRKSAAPHFGAGLQLGATGVALGLLAACSQVPPDWDRAFLVTLPPLSTGP